MHLLQNVYVYIYIYICMPAISLLITTELKGPSIADLT